MKKKYVSHKWCSKIFLDYLKELNQKKKKLRFTVIFYFYCLFSAVFNRRFEANCNH